MRHLQAVDSCHTNPSPLYSIYPKKFDLSFAFSLAMQSAVVFTTFNIAVTQQYLLPELYLWESLTFPLHVSNQNPADTAVGKMQPEPS